MKTKLLAVAALWISSVCVSVSAEPTHQDLRYSPNFEKSTLDLWLPKSDEPTPVVVFFHGGGFKSGSKNWIPFKKEFLGLLDRKVAMASVGYPLLGDQGKSDRIGAMDYEKILAHTTKAIAFLKKHARDYNLDIGKIVVAGSSAGALISNYLAYQEDLGVSVCIGIQQPYETKRVIEVIDKGEAPLILYTSSGPADWVHSPDHARRIKEHCDAIGQACYLFGSPKSGLPQIPGGASFVDHAFGILSEIWD